jgi:hypothetical protein
MSEAKINVATGFNGGLSVSLRADTAAEFDSLVSDALQSPTLAALLRNAGLNANVPDEAQAVANIQAVMPGTVVAPPVSTVGQPLPQPQPAAAPTAQPSAVPPGVAYPGDCAHGPRVYKNTYTKRGAWARFECAIPWSRDGGPNRCQPVNV